MTVMNKLTGRPAKPASTLGALPKLTDHKPYNDAVEKAMKIRDLARPLHEKLKAIDAKLDEAVQVEKAVKAARGAAVAEILAGAGPGKEWQLPTPANRLRERRGDVRARLDMVQLAGGTHDADSVRPARSEALRLAQVGVVRDHFGPAVVAMLAPLAEFVRRREAVARVLAELEAAGLDGGPVSAPHYPYYLFGPGCDFADALRQFVREVADAGTITPADAATLTGS